MLNSKVLISLRCTELVHIALLSIIQVSSTHILIIFPSTVIKGLDRDETILADSKTNPSAIKEDLGEDNK